MAQAQHRAARKKLVERLRYDLKLSRQERAILVGLRKRKKLDDWVVDAPEVDDSEAMYLRAFRRLDTCRSFEGRIPWTAIDQYVARFIERSGADADLHDEIVEVLVAMDAEWTRKDKRVGGKGSTTKTVNRRSSTDDSDEDGPKSPERTRSRRIGRGA